MPYEGHGPKTYTASRDWDDIRADPLTRDVSFNKHSINDGQHVSPFDNARASIGTDEITIKLVQGLHPDMEEVLSKATRATIGIDLSQPDSDTRDWEEMLQGGLQTALESQVIVFEVAGVSRACTHQLVRTRKAAFHQQSMRASYYGDQPWTRIPESIWLADDTVRNAYIEAIRACHKAYKLACEDDISYQDARYILPEGTANYILCEYSLREFMNFYAYRACSMFMWETVSVARAMGQILTEAYPFLEPYVKISCEKTKGALDRPYDEDDPSTHHTCMYMGWEKVDGQCNFAYARETNRTFTSKLHTIG